MTQVFDGHNDALGRLWCGSRDPVGDFGRDIGHVNAVQARAGGLAGGFFAMFAPQSRVPFDFSAFSVADLEIPLPAMLDEAQALQAVIGQAGIAHALQEAGHLRICTDAQTLGHSFMDAPIACLLHLEGADCIGPDLLALETLHALGMRSLGLVWSRPTIFGHGVPFRHDSDGDTGAGLTDLGKRLVTRCLALGITIDTSHLTMKGFWDVAETGAPMVATHSNAHAVCPNARNLTDRQLQAVKETGGMVGLNFATVFLSDAGWRTGKAGIEDCLRQLDHMIAVAGEDHVGLGSDFDGAPLPQGIAHAGDLPRLIAAMRRHGYGETLIAKLAHENWLDFMSRQLG
ncbi:Dipeptidase AC Metallopeptidase MEROPS family M19 [Sulfitobacter noctilucicola]|uniref:Membrane dipeptidase n=1 Tax=Sulfitobacter noctilucicola TaxID=1342301 RepID=A0A7W6M6W8_9RHOB|nr:dipeptidase [Sulfitobacter noctilucicola]KIN61928.1 Dipeptidase AC Metallopeptidase MEROPS family M19 [Sulfitobacter noctilucicola]MBB4173550.1 membrane dipeptidase [Sulfitobacter noctilucicola]